MQQPVFELTDLTEAVLATGTYDYVMAEFNERASKGPQPGFVVRKTASTRRAESAARKRARKK